MKKPILSMIAVVSSTALLLTSCSNPNGNSADTSASPTEAASSSEAHEDHDHGSHDDMEAGEGETEVAQLPNRVVISYEGGLKTYDAKTGKVLNEEDMPAFLRLANAGDKRHVMVTKGDKFLTYDSGLITKPHGDHNHYYTAEPTLDDATYDAPHAGHVVSHDGFTALFSDGNGTVQIIPDDQIADPKDVKTFESGAAHHGVAVPFKDGSVVMTKGTEDERHTIQHKDKDGKVLAETDQCPGVHGEAAAGNGNIFFGCEDGPVVFDGKEFHKIDVSSYAGKDGYQRSGNSAGSEESNVILADNKTDKDAEQEHPTSVSLINTEDYSTKKVELGSSYWFRSLARGPLGEALVLTNDGKLNIIDADSGEVTKRIDAISEWKENEEWQLPGPILKSEDGYAYVTDANKKELVVIDLLKGEEVNRFELDYQPTEMSVL
ncbi:MAG: hypothetical protein L0L28_00100 [Corynebacterium flavescens]|uniref:hypothetical protein n=1 Tax=Corynebacterium flavescens TaxID=28028 RepID=UPI00264A2DD1|nr:hypothetical protein [Corynebacterium flavescens]MDN6551161.1 hypothetical protein [Corynebacterium flavescens]